MQGTELRNLTFVDAANGLTVVVRHGTVPGTITHDIAGGAGNLPELQIDYASFQKSFTAGGPSSRRSIAAIVRQVRDAVTPNARAARTINGHIWATLETGYIDVPLDLRLRDGELDLRRLVSTAERGVPALTADVEDGTRVVLNANVPVPLPGVGVHVEKVALLRWDLNSGQVTHFAQTGRVDWVDLLNPTGRLLNLRVGGGPAGPSQVRLVNLAADLSMRSSRSIPVDLGALGTLTLAPDALAHLVLSGGVGGASAAGGRPGLVLASLERVSVEESHLTFPGTTVDTGGIEVQDVDDVRLTFSDFEPRLLSGQIRRATARNIRWHRSAP